MAYGSADGSNMVLLAVDATGTRRLVIVGPAAEDAAAAGNPLRMGVTYKATPTAVDDTDIVSWLGDGYGRGEVLDGSVQEVEALASAARTATASSGDLRNPGATGAIITVNVTAAPGPAPDVDLHVRYRVPNTAVYLDLFVAAAGIAATGNFVYVVHPGWGAAAHGVTEVENAALPRTWETQMVHNNANSITYSVQVSYLK